MFEFKTVSLTALLEFTIFFFSAVQLNRALS